VSQSTRPRWTPVVVLASLYVFVNVVELGVGDGGWPQIVGVPLGVAVAVYAVARVLGWEGVKR
jgi:hypothetical protein